MFALLIPLLAQLPGLFGSFFKQKNDLLTAQNAAQLQIEIAKLNLAGEIAKAQMAEEAVIVTSTGSYFKYFTFFMWFGPFMLGIFFPTLSKQVFDNLAGMPPWYVQGCLVIMFTVWGISISADTVGNVFSSLSNFFAERNKANLPAKMFFDTLRSVKGNISQAEVDLYNKALAEHNKDVNG